jgi:hypothetical protein
MKKYLLLGVFWCLGMELAAQGGFGAMNFQIFGGVQDASGVAIQKAQVRGFVISKDSVDRMGISKLSDWLNNNPSVFFELETNDLGVFEESIGREKLQELRGKGMNLRESMMILDVIANGYDRSLNVVKPEMIRAELGLRISVGITTLLKSEERIEGVEIKTKAIEMKGDTAEINASHYKVNPDASAEDLVRKMPGVTLRNGEVEAQGEKVARVLVDGKPYFGEDPKAAFKNVPAESISKIQIYDAQSEQSRFTGFDDGNTTKTINIITKSGFKNGQFGKFYGGVGRSIEGTGDLGKYKTGVTYNRFNEDRRVSVLFQSNNINEQNFSFDDVSSSFRGGDFGRRGMGDFFVNGNEGITKSHLFGLNYSDKWGKNWVVSGSYFFSQSDNFNESTTDRWFISGNTNRNDGLKYFETASQRNISQQHRFSSRLEWNIDSNDRIIFQPRITFQNRDQKLPISGVSSLGDQASFISSLLNIGQNISSSYNTAMDINYVHAFNKRGRSLAIELVPSYNGTLGTNDLNYTFTTQTNRDERKQQTQIDQGVYGLGTKIEFTEPLDSIHSVLLTYEWNVNQNNSDRINYLPEFGGGPLNVLDTLLSSRFQNGYSRQAYGARFQRIKKGFTYIIGVDAQTAQLTGTQVFPNTGEINRPFFSILPQLTIRSGKMGANGIRLIYRTSNNAPSVTQLQDVVNNANPLQLTMGNAQLGQDYQHRLFSRYFNMDASSGRMFFVFLRGTASMNALTTLTRIASGNGGGIQIPTGDTSYFLRPGAQISKPVNIDGAFNLGSRINWSRPVLNGKVNVNSGLSFDYRETPSLVQVDHGAMNRNTSKNPSLGIDLGFGSNISERLDFNISSNTSYSRVINTLQVNLNEAYWIQRSGLQLNWMPGGKWVINTDFNHQYYRGQRSTFNLSMFLWNASVGRKFGSNNAWDFRIQMYDLLNQNQSLVRNVNETFFEDVRTTVLTRYVMVQLTYNLRAFKGVKSEDEGMDQMHKMYYQRMYKR